MVDQMISSQLGSLNTAAPTAPVWREPKLEQMKEMEEGKKDADELAPMYVEGRTIQMDQPWRQKAPMMVAGILLLGIAVLLFSQLGSPSGPGEAMPVPDASPAADTKGDMEVAAGSLLPQNATVQNKTAEQAPEIEVPVPAGMVSDNASNSFNSPNETTAQVNNSARLENYKASCSTLVKLHGACDYDLSGDDKSLPTHTLVRLVCPAECQILDRYKKICPSLLKLDGGCAHDLAMEETNLPHGSYVRLVCEDCQEEITTTMTSTMAITSTTTAKVNPVSPAPERERPELPKAPVDTAVVGQTEAIKIRPSRWLAYVVSIAATVAWAGLCMQEYGWLRVLGRDSS